jgi:hypothetical protein
MEARDLIEYYTQKRGTALECYVASLFAHAMKEGDPTRGEAALYPLVGKIRPPASVTAIQINGQAPSFSDVFERTNAIAYAQIQRLEEKAKNQELEREDLQILAQLQRSLVDAKEAYDRNVSSQRQEIARMSTEEIQAELKAYCETNDTTSDGK